MFLSSFRAEIDIDNPQHEQYAASIVAELIHELEAKANAMTSEDLILTKYKLIDTANAFKVRDSFCDYFVPSTTMVIIENVFVTATLCSLPFRFVSLDETLLEF